MAKSTWAIDPTHSEIGFKVKHMMFTNVSGKFNAVEATIENEDDKFETSKINFSAEVHSVDTNNQDRDNHLKSGDFFDVEKFPKLSFVSTGIHKVNDGEYKISGDLTIKDVTKNVTLATEYSGAMKDPWGNTKVGLSINGNINRKDFGLTWNSALETGGVLVGEDVKLVAEIQFVKQ
ncbi:YceI family protein [Flavobacterium granuli]|uniref:Polyisoprenoid-binding protein YceI n=1 Tax=Flavobacterium granuli TaxID=280093 RepID=A0A1M5S2H7_9FLAO|nr:YceI family protein [Flavobacterium granuli]PRZ21185.1 polyisoprenoid-binding protein YceI [Flavobacterium granuli]SHH32656.1 Polyisoprenoid-binding protein YceI [Flavobacterium granuli]